MESTTFLNRQINKNIESQTMYFFFDALTSWILVSQDFVGSLKIISLLKYDS
jgi:hypothetical protein